MNFLLDELVEDDKCRELKPRLEIVSSHHAMQMRLNRVDREVKYLSHPSIRISVDQKLD